MIVIGTDIHRSSHTAAAASVTGQPVDELTERELAQRVESRAPQLLGLVGCGPLTAAKILGKRAGIERFACDAKLARLAGVAPRPRFPLFAGPG